MIKISFTGHWVFDSERRDSLPLGRRKVLLLTDNPLAIYYHSLATGNWKPPLLVCVGSCLFLSLFLFLFFK